MDKKKETERLYGQSGETVGVKEVGAEPPPKMQYEYLVVDLDVSQDAKNEYVQALLNAYGKRGWRTVQLLPGGAGPGILPAVFEKEKW